MSETNDRLLSDISDNLYYLNKNLCLLIDIIANSSVNVSHTRKHIESEIERVWVY